MSASIAFNYDKPMRSDFLLVQRAIRNRWPIPPETRASLTEFCMKAKLDGRTDRIVELANETLGMLAETFEKTVAELPEQTRLTTNPNDKPKPDKVA